jgi:hypothetical protein
LPQIPCYEIALSYAPPTLAALAGCGEAEIATFTRHRLKDVGAILDAHDLSRDSRMAESALVKREAYEAGTKVAS